MQDKKSLPWTPISVLLGLLTFATVFPALKAFSDPPKETDIFPTQFLCLEDLQFLKSMTADVLEASRVREGEKVDGFGPNTTGGSLIRPGGRDCYPAFWIRDYAMSLDCGMVSLEEQHHMLLLTAAQQPDREIILRSGSKIPPGSIPDHITFKGLPIFFPGTIDDFEGQGGNKWGDIPPLDDPFFFVKMAKAYVDECANPEVLSEKINGKSLLVRLEEAFNMPPSDPLTGIVRAEEGQRGIAFGFTDTTLHTGDLLVPSLLKYRAAKQLSDLFLLTGDDRNWARYRETAATLRNHIGATFMGDHGLLKASTGMSSQEDGWGSAMAVCFGALEPKLEKRVSATLTALLRSGNLAWRGSIRHVPIDRDFSEDSSWEVSLVEKNTYQNGAYWSTPTGWVCLAAAQSDPVLARQLAADFIDELREGDFRKGPDAGSPWECLHPSGHRQNPVYLTSVAVPLGVFMGAD